MKTIRHMLLLLLLVLVGRRLIQRFTSFLKADHFLYGGPERQKRKQNQIICGSELFSLLRNTLTQSDCRPPIGRSPPTLSSCVERRSRPSERILRIRPPCGRATWFRPPVSLWKNNEQSEEVLFLSRIILIL